MATVTEIASGVYRINVVLPDRPVSYSLFLVDDDSPTLIETSFSAVFDEVKTAVESVVDLKKIERIIVPHFEGDECGGLNDFLAAAPNAVAVCSPIGSSSIRDFTGKDPLVIADNEELVTGSKKAEILFDAVRSRLGQPIGSGGDAGNALQLGPVHPAGPRKGIH